MLCVTAKKWVDFYVEFFWIKLKLIPRHVKKHGAFHHTGCLHFRAFPRSCLNQIDSWAKNGTDNISSKSTPSSAFSEKQLECDALQQQYEHAFCIHRLSKVRQCQENHRCYESNKATYDQQAALVNSPLGLVAKSFKSFGFAF